MEEEAAVYENFGALIDENGTIELYGCGVAEGAQGAAYIQQIADTFRRKAAGYTGNCACKWYFTEGNWRTGERVEKSPGPRKQLRSLAKHRRQQHQRSVGQPTSSTSTPLYVVVRAGQTISQVAQEYGGYYNRTDKWKTANPHIKNMDLIRPGDRIYLPAQ